MGEKKGEEEEGGSPMELFGGLISEVKNTVFTYIYIYVKTALFGIRKIEPDMRNVARTIGFRAFGIL